MDRLAEQVVAWHNRHPLAKRITIYDVHTMGLVALPFMRSGGGDLPVEPVLTDEVSPDSLAAAWDAVADPDVSDEALAAEAPADLPAADEAETPQAVANPQDSPLEASLDEETRPASHEQRSASAAPPPAAPRWWQRLNPLGWRATGKRSDAMHWPVFSERFIPNLSPRRVSTFALKYGYANPPRGPDWPQRVVAIDDDLLDRGAPRGASGSWPYEIYLMSAGIDAGKSRSRVLVGMRPNRQSVFLGARCWSLVRVGLLALVLAGIALAATAMFRSHGASDGQGGADAAASAASAATPASAPASVPSSAPSAAAPMAASEPAAAASSESAAPAASAASAPDAAASPILAASSAGEPLAQGGAPAPAAPATIPNIRPQLAQQLKPALPGASKPASGTTAPAAASKAIEDDRKARSTPAMPENKAGKPHTSQPKTSPPAAEAVRRKAAATTPAEELASPRIQPGDLPAGAQTPSADGKRVALVGPGSANKAEAEAMLARMLDHVQQTMGRDAPVQAQIFKSPEGWRPAIWPFVTREQAQLVNATLIARGVRAKAIDF